MNELALFAGAGGGILGGHLLGWRTVCAVEWDAYAASVLVHRQNDGCLPPFPIWDDVQTFSGRPWRGRVDVISGGFPCTDISSAGKGAGIDGEQSGMWAHMARIVGEVRPRNVFVENSPMLVGRGLARVLGDLASLGYDAKWGVLGAHHVAAPHKRDRMWIVAHSNERRAAAVSNGKQSRRTQSCSISADVAHTASARFQARGGDRMGAEHGPCRNEGQFESASSQTPVAHSECKRGRGRNPGRKDAANAWKPSRHPGNNSEGMGWWDIEPKLGRVAYGVAHRVDRLKCIGNGQVPQCAALAWQILSGQNYEHIQPAEHRPD